MAEPTTAEIEAVTVLIAHGRTRIEGCHCGWGMDGSKLGQSHALHVWRELQRAVLPDHDARREAELRAAGWHPSGQCIRVDVAAMLEAAKTGDTREEIIARLEAEWRARGWAPRAEVAEEIAQAIEARAAVARRTVALEPGRHDEDAAIARSYATPPGAVPDAR